MKYIFVLFACFWFVSPAGAQLQKVWLDADTGNEMDDLYAIAAVKALPKGEKLDILTIGAMTNIASALILAPEIKSGIRCYSLGAQFNAGTSIWNKNEFNIRNDLNAFDYLLNLDGFDFTVMSLEAAHPLQFKRDETYLRLDEKQEVERILKNRWVEQNPQDETRIMWDLALVEAYLNPALAQLKIVKTPPENKQ